MTTDEITIAELCLALKKLDDQGKALTEEVSAINKSLAESVALLREVVELSKNSPLMTIRQQVVGPQLIG